MAHTMLHGRTCFTQPVKHQAMDETLARFSQPSSNVAKVFARSSRHASISQRQSTSLVRAQQVLASVASLGSADIETNSQENASGTAGAVVLERRTPNKATELRNLVFVSSEAAPWSKTGGLADVIGSLPIALAARGHRVMVVTPRYGEYKDVFDTGVRAKLLSAEVGYFHCRHKGVDWVFVDHPSYPRPGGLYADKFGPYGDNQFRFTILCLAACEAPLLLDLPQPGSGNGNGNGHATSTSSSAALSKYGQDCVFIANDWHAALVPVYLANKYRPNGVYQNARSILAIHNLCHQGVFPPSSFFTLGMPDNWYGGLEWQYPPHQRQGSYAEEGRSINHMKAGITTADRIMTVSAGYAEEICTYLGGWGMDGLLSSRQFVLNGVVNGIDIEDWSPDTDPYIAQRYDTTNFTEGKRACKLALQKELGLPVNEHIPLIAFIGRLDPQKGADILLQAAPQLLQQSDVQLVCLGSGNPDLEAGLRWLENTYRDKARGWVGFNVPLSHRLTAAADIVLMPSRFEPCGLNQLYAMRYGAVPVAHKTGGLKDTVIDFDPWKQAGTGWTYTDCSAQGLLHAIGLALMTYRNHNQDWRKLQLRGMTREASWDVAAQQYEQIFSWAVMDPPFCK